MSASRCSSCGGSSHAPVTRSAPPRGHADVKDVSRRANWVEHEHVGRAGPKGRVCGIGREHVRRNVVSIQIGLRRPRLDEQELVGAPPDREQLVPKAALLRANKGSQLREGGELLVGLTRARSDVNDEVNRAHLGIVSTAARQPEARSPRVSGALGSFTWRYGGIEAGRPGASTLLLCTGACSEV